MNVLDFLKHLTDSQYIINWGSLAILAFIVFAECSFLVGFFLPGNSLIFYAGFICHSKPETLGVGLPVLIIVLSLAAMLGYYIGYWFGAKKWSHALTETTRFFLFKKKPVDWTIQFFDDHLVKTLIVGRYIPFIRTFAPVVAGMLFVNYKKYMIYNIIGAFIWVGSLAGAGYFFGSNLWFERNISYIVNTLIIITVLTFIVKTRVAKNY